MSGGEQHSAAAAAPACRRSRGPIRVGPTQGSAAVAAHVRITAQDRLKLARIREPASVMIKTTQLSRGQRRRPIVQRLQRVPCDEARHVHGRDVAGAGG